VSREVRQDETGAFQVRFPFDRALVDRIKTLPNRRWNPSGRFWSVPREELGALVEMLQPLGFRFDTATRRTYGEMGGTLPLEEGDPPDYSVSSLNLQVKTVIEGAFPHPVWLVGEISSFDRNAHKRHVTFQLVELDDRGKTVSKVEATLFEQSRRAVEQTLQRAGDPFRLEDGLTVRLQARVELYVPWGSYRIVVEDLDPSYTLGEAARRREEIVRRLRESGLAERNRALAFPALPLRIGVITSLGSDAHEDVLRTLQESGYAFRLVCHGARVQGRATEPSVLNALDRLRKHAAELDVVLICRGGGSRTDLAWFDSEALGRAVALFPLPVVIGIGHEQDRSVLDEIGWRCKTPTAAAGYLVETVRRSLETLEQTCATLLEAATRRLAEERQRQAQRGGRLVRSARSLLERELDTLGHRRARTGRAATVHLARQRVFLDNMRRAISQAASRDVVSARGRIDETAQTLAPRAGRLTAGERERLDLRSRRLHLVDPRRVVERGYAILRGAEGGVLTDAAEAPAGTRVQAELRGGRLALRSLGPPERAEEDEPRGQER